MWKLLKNTAPIHPGTVPEASDPTLSYANRMRSDRQWRSLQSAFSTSGKETLTLFQRTLKELGIQHKLIRPFTPRHNGKSGNAATARIMNVFTSHTFYSFEDFSCSFKPINRRDYNQFPMRPLGKSPQTVLREFIDRGVICLTNLHFKKQFKRFKRRLEKKSSMLL